MILNKEFVFFALLITFCPFTYGQNVITPSTPTPAAWNNVANWDGSGIANTIGEDADFSGANVGEVEVPNGYSVTVGNVDLIQGNTFTIISGGVMNIGSTGSGNERDLTTDNNTIINVYGDLIIWGDMVVNNGLTLNVTGNLTIKGDMILKNNAGVDISGTGSVVIDGNLDGGNNTDVNVDGSLDVGGDISVGNGSTLIGNGTVNVGGGCTDGTSDFCSTGPLPVELLDFKAIAEETAVNLFWATASELNNEYFTLEKSRNGKDFEVVAEIDGNETKSEISNYNYTDYNPLIGLSYYQLSQTDFDGTTEVFPLISVIYNGKYSFSVSPNPMSGERINLRATGENKNEKLTLSIINLKGQLVDHKTIYSDNFGNVEMDLQLNKPLKKGMYILELESKSKKEYSKIIAQ